MPTRIAPSEWTPQGEDIEQLEPAAEQAVSSSEHTAVTAGPGSGKTELLVQRACYLLQTRQCLRPYRIVALTYKVDASKELRERVSDRCHSDLAHRFESYTYASFAMRLLQQGREALPDWCRPGSNFKPLLNSDLKKFVKDFAAELNKQWPRYLDISRLKATIDSRIPIDGFSSDSRYGVVAEQWWRYNLYHRDVPHLTFSMMTRLVDLLIRINPGFKNGLRSTYSHIFLDEFQDTTLPQYQLVKSSFLGSSSILTAVGDDKQHIMGFTGALTNAFDRFENDFGAKTLELKLNHRSSPELVSIQRVLISDIDPDAVHTRSNQSKEIADDACEIINCDSTAQEARLVAEEIQDRKANEGLTGDQFAIIVRQKTGDFMPALEAEFDRKGMKIRNDNEVQNLLSERLTEILLTFLRLGIANDPGPYWSDATEILHDLHGLPERGHQHLRGLEGELDEFKNSLSTLMDDVTPNKKINVELLIDKVLSFLDRCKIRVEYRKYREKPQFEYWVDKFTDYLVSVGDSHSEWANALDEFEGVDTTPVMTLYKSKGLEYHTVFFIGVEDEVWWPIEEEPQDTRRQFLVAFSRAEQRVVVTNSADRGSVNEVEDLYALLEQAGVESRSAGDFLTSFG
jgi:superfamily I DNA/RNA helicase